MPLAYPSIVILTGAGISAESGLKTFRDSGGLWESHRPQDVASIEAFRSDPEMVQRFYNFRRSQLATVHPNPGHFALAELEQAWQGDFLLVTQNVDDLHERAGSSRMIHMHGELLKARCFETELVFDWDGSIKPETSCPCCNKSGKLRPHITWFGEFPMKLDQIDKALKKCDIFVSIGTSGLVYPAAGFIQRVRASARTIEVNIEPSTQSRRFQEHRIGSANVHIPGLVRELLQGL